MTRGGRVLGVGVYTRMGVHPLTHAGSHSYPTAAGALHTAASHTDQLPTHANFVATHLDENVVSHTQAEKAQRELEVFLAAREPRQKEEPKTKDSTLESRKTFVPLLPLPLPLPL